LTLNSGVGIKDAAGSNCGITVNSSATNAVSANVCNTTIVGSFNVVGGVQENCTNWGANSTPKTGATAAVDPFKSLAVPAKGTTQASNNLSIGGATTLSPGYYSGGINFNSPNSGTYTVTLSPGVYYIDGGININSGVTVTGTGVTIYLASGSFNVNSGATLKLTAPSTGSTADMIIWQAKSDTSGMNLDSTSSDSWGGAVYVPGATLTLNSDSNAVAYGMVVANTVMLNSVITLSCGSMPGGSCPGGSGASGPVAGGVSLVL
jgi:hypothetical protein